MSLSEYAQKLRSGQPPQFPADCNSLEFAQKLDAEDTIRHLRDEFVIPTKASLQKTTLDGSIPQTPQSSHDPQQGIYFVGNSLGAQPKAVRTHLTSHLETWASIGVNGHFKSMESSPLPSWQDMAASCSVQSAPLVGASPSEVVVMNTLSVNLHLMMASFYKPTPTRHKIILEWKPFPSDHYAIESQIEWHGLDPKTSMVKIEPDEGSQLISTERILQTIDEHKEDAAMILLPGIQYYSGQLFDIPRITAHARAAGLVVGWDLAHAAGNVELQLHDWDVDFACWCTYKYMNAGPGAIAGVFVHERHGRVEPAPAGSPREHTFRPRLMGWYGGDKSVRFNMDNKFLPTSGAQGYQLSNPSAIDLASLAGALSVFDKTSMAELRSKALVLTAYLEVLLDQLNATFTSSSTAADNGQPFTIITPRDPLQRGTQLSILLREGLLEPISEALEAEGVMCDKRKPGVIRVAPVPLYSRFEDVWRFCSILRGALEKGA